MPHRYDRYGFDLPDLDAAVPIVEAAIGAPLEERDSSYYAGTYYRYRLRSGQGARLYKNRDPNTGALVRSEHAAFAVLLEIDDLPDMDGIASRLVRSAQAPQLLSSKLLDDDDEDEASTDAGAS